MFSPGELADALRGYGFQVRLLPVNELTAAQLRKVPTELGKAVVARLPVAWLPPWLCPHLEVEATRRV